MRVSCRQLQPALVVYGTVLQFCVFSPKLAVMVPEEAGAEWSRTADEVREGCSNKILHFMLFHHWERSCCCCTILPGWRALLSPALLMQHANLCW